MPAELNTGFLLDMKNKFIISGNFNYIFWRSVQDNSGNEPQISGSFIYNASDLFTGSIGLLYSSKLYDNFVEIGNKISALYFTIGAQINFYNFYADLSLADSHLAGGEWRKHTIGKFALGYNF